MSSSVLLGENCALLYCKSDVDLSGFGKNAFDCLGNKPFDPFQREMNVNLLSVK